MEKNPRRGAGRSDIECAGDRGCQKHITLPCGLDFELLLGLQKTNRKMGVVFAHN